jgi:phage terminase small subunit
LQFIVEFLEDGNVKQAALRAGIPETYASRQGAWLKKHPIVLKALEADVDGHDLKKLKRALRDIDSQIDICKKILGLEEI